VTTIPFLQSPLILDPADPMATARTFVGLHYEHRGQRTLLHHAAEWRAWTGSHYPMIEEAIIRARLWSFLERAHQPGPKGQPVPFKPTSARVANALDALRAVCNLPASVTPPIWLRTSKIPAREIIACGNGLLHLPARRLHPHDPAFSRSMRALSTSIPTPAALSSCASSMTSGTAIRTLSIRCRTGSDIRSPAIRANTRS